jgi:hypothetical protein
MVLQKNKNLVSSFLKSLSRIRGWNYHNSIETEKRNEIKAFISAYVFKDIYENHPSQIISYYRLKFLFERPSVKPAIYALIMLLENSNNEKEFEERYRKCR